MRDDRLKHLDRAFTPTPPELSGRVEAAFERGEKAVKQRHKIMTALSVAAALAVMFAALALAAGQMLKPRVDNVVAARGNGTAQVTSGPSPAVYEDSTDSDGEIAVTKTDRTETPDIWEDAVYYATLNGVYFHADEHCMGMQAAKPVSLNAAWALGKAPCPVCLAGFEYPEVTYYATKGGTYYHVIRDCMGMKNAKAYTLEAARAEGKGPCPECLPETPTFCWATPKGTYYHQEETCMGMHTARLYTVVYARAKGKRPCPVCVTGD